MNTVIIDEHEIVHWGVSEFLRNSLFDVVAHCHSLREYSQLMASGLVVDLVLTECIVDGIGLSGVVSTIKQQRDTAKCIVFSEVAGPVTVQRAKDLGADGYIFKSVTASEFVDQLRGFLGDGSIWTRERSETNIGSTGIATVDASPY